MSIGTTLVQSLLRHDARTCLVLVGHRNIAIICTDLEIRRSTWIGCSVWSFFSQRFALTWTTAGYQAVVCFLIKASVEFQCAPTRRHARLNVAATLSFLLLIILFLGLTSYLIEKLLP